MGEQEGNDRPRKGSDCDGKTVGLDKGFDVRDEGGQGIKDFLMG